MPKLLNSGHINLTKYCVLTLFNYQILKVPLFLDAVFANYCCFYFQDNPIGSGTGKYKDRKLFKAKQNHASLVPILGLMKASDLKGNM